MTATVVIVQELVPHYRVGFFRRLERLCAESGIDLHLVHGPEQPGASPRSVGPGVLPEGQDHWVPGRRIGPFVWQPLPRALRHCDLVIVEHANRPILNHLLHLRRFLGLRRPRFAFWGHERNRQGQATSWREVLKRRLRSHCDFWFCYTDEVYEALTEVPPSRKIAVNNAIDTEDLAERIRTLAATEAKDPYNLLFIGSMRPDKRLDLLCEAMEIVFAQEPRATLSFVGDGPDAPIARAFCARHPDRTIWHGPLLGLDAAPALWRASAIVIPGAVGLVVLDSFVAQAPMITTFPNELHGPEIAYCNSMCNAIFSLHDPRDYAQSICKWLHNSAIQLRLMSSCRESAKLHTLDRMAQNFMSGIKKFLTNLKHER